MIFTITTLSCSSDLPVVTIHTEIGDISLEIDTISAPVTSANFLAHSKMGTYRNSMFYRVVNDHNQPGDKVKIDVIQGGLYIDSLVDLQSVIIHESTEYTGLRHRNGTISMARMEPGSASTEFFICIGQQPELDFGGKRNPDGQGFAAFGRVINGMTLVKEIQSMENTGQYLDQAVKISDINLN